MSQNFGAFLVNPYIGQPYGQAIKSCTPIDKAFGPRVVRLDIDWLTYGASSANQQIGVNFNLQNQQNPQTGLDAIRSVYIDNTFSPVPVYVLFQDSLHAIVCPAYGTVIAPCFTNLQQGTVFAEGFLTGQVPQTRFHFMNIEKEMAYIPTDPGGAFSNPVILTYNGTTAAAQAGSFNFASIPIGDADTDRVVVGVINASGSTPANVLNVAGSTFGGVAVVQGALADSGPFGIAPFNYNRTYIWYAPVPTGTTMAVVLNKSGASSMSIRASFYSIRNLLSPTPIAANVNQGTTQIARSISLNAAANGCVLAGGNGLVTASGPGFSGMSQDDYALLFGLGDSSISASLLPLASSAINVGPVAACRSVAAVSWN